MARQEVSGPDCLDLAPGQTSLTAQYLAAKTPAVWSVDVRFDDVLDPDDYTLEISQTGALTFTLAPGVTIPPDGIHLTLELSASFRGLPGRGNNDSLLVTVKIPDPAVPCFVAGSLIATPDGPRPVEALRPGDRVLTLEGRSCPVRWCARRTLSAAALDLSPALRPIRIRAHAFGRGRPVRDLLLSPQHRVYFEGWQTELLFSRRAVLAHAIHLVDGHAVRRDDDTTPVTYVHFALDRHEVVLADGLATETLYPGDAALNALDRDAAAELRALFPELESPARAVPMHSPCVKRHEGALLSPARRPEPA